MNKHGFTLIEIIICISMIVLIGAGSFIGIRIVNKNIVKKGLDQLTTKAVQATQVYIESNKEAQTQLYEKNNILYLPIKVLLNEGLLNLQGTSLSNKDIENQYTITALSSTTGDEKDCVDISTKTSWDDSKAIYICTYIKSDGSSEGSKSSVIKKLVSINSNQYTAKGANPNNWVTFDELSKKIRVLDDYNFKFRIVSIDNDKISLIPNVDNRYALKNGREYCYSISSAYDNCTGDDELISCMNGFNFDYKNDCFIKIKGIRYNYIDNFVKYKIYESSSYYNSRILLYNEVLNSYGNDNESWLPRNMFLGFVDKEKGCDSSYVNDNEYISSSLAYPVFTLVLSDKVNLVEDACSLNDETISGTENCPYRIEIKDNYCGLE